MNDEQLRRHAILEQVARERAQVAEQERARCRKVAGLFTHPDDFAALCVQMLDYSWRENPGPDQQDTIDAACETWTSAFHYFAIAHRFTGSLMIHQMRGKRKGEFRAVINDNPSAAASWRRLLIGGAELRIPSDELDGLWAHAEENVRAKSKQPGRTPPRAARASASARSTRRNSS